MMNVRDLDLMSYREKTLHWLRPDAWNPNGARLRFSRPAGPLRVSTDRRGTVMNMPLLIGRPCFGIITAFIRYKDSKKLVRGRGWLPDSRCADCPIRESCERLVKERIRSFAPLSAAYDEWLLAEGPSQFNKPNFDNTHVGRLWKRVGLVAADAPFSSVNEAQAAEHYAGVDQEALGADRRRKVKKRERDRRAGKIDSGHLTDLETAANSRVIDILEAMDDPRPLRELRHLPIPSLEDMRDVWLGREVLRAERRNNRAPDIARWIQATGRRNESATFAALCTRVHKDLNRIARFQRTMWQGAPLLKPFDPERESWSQISLELAA